MSQSNFTPGGQVFVPSSTFNPEAAAVNYPQAAGTGTGIPTQYSADNPYAAQEYQAGGGEYYDESQGYYEDYSAGGQSTGYEGYGEGVAVTGAEYADYGAYTAEGAYIDQPAVGWYTRSMAYVGGMSAAPQTTVKYDSNYELLWCGGEDGFASSYHRVDMELYSRFQVSSRADNGIRAALTIDSGILFATNSTLSFRDRGGYALLTVEDPIQGITCADWVDARGPRSSTVVIGGTDQLATFDLGSRRMSGKVDVPSGISCLARNRSSLICGTIGGSTELRDSSSFAVLHKFDGHTGGVSSLDVRNDMVVTCGYATNRQGHLSFDSLIKVYDLRFNKPRPLNSVPAPQGCSFVRWHPLIPNQLIATSQSGQVVIIPDAVSQIDPPQYYQVQSGGASIVAMDICSTAELMSFVDEAGNCHQFTDREGPLKINMYSAPLEVPDVHPPPPAVSLQRLGTNDKEPWNGMRLERTNEVPLSTFPEQYQFRTFPYAAPTVPIPEVIRANATQSGFMQVAKNVKKWKRNQVRPALTLKEYISLVNTSRGIKSVPDTSDLSSPLRHKRLESLGIPDDTPNTKARRRLKLPRQYVNPTIKESKLNMGTFEFGTFNKTRFCGLENTHTNSYINSFLYLLYFLEPVRDNLLAHLCDREHCMACELHFIYKMFTEMRGTNCHAGNAERVFRHIPQASALGILQVAEHHRGLAAPSMNLTIARRIENFNRFILSELHKELSTLSPAPRLQRVQAPQQGPNPISTVVDHVFGSDAVLTRKCQKCATESTQNKRSFVVELSEPGPPVDGFDPNEFATLLQKNFQRETYSKAWCEKCSAYTTSLHTNTTTSLPHLLNINCPLELTGSIPVAQTRAYAGDMGDGLGGADDGETITSVTAGGRTYPASVLPTRTMLPGAVRLTICKEGGTDTSDAAGDDKGKEDTFIVDSMADVKQLAGLPPPPENSESAVYELVAVVSHILDPQLKIDADEQGRDDYEGHLVVHIKVPPSYHKHQSSSSNKDGDDDASSAPATPKPDKSSASAEVPMGTSPAHNVAVTDWYLFNDFAITPTESFKEVTGFHSSWKVPVVIVLRRLDLTQHISPSPAPSIVNARALLSDIPYSRRTPERRTFRPLAEEELSQTGFHVAIDCEFVALTEEVVEFLTDGTKVTVKTPELGLGRVSVLRGEPGPKQGVPFIDDYIVATEPVVDYLTRFSGLEPGDLDPNTSRHHLTTLKTSYLKLRWLVDNGCVFIGHGLSKDFRIINILVPPERVIDTVHLFSLPKKRKISLRFLAWWILGIDVQRGNHDSIEDALTALKLYHKYLELKEEGKVEETVKHLYAEGPAVNFQVPTDGRLPPHLMAQRQHQQEQARAATETVAPPASQ